MVEMKMESRKIKQMVIDGKPVVDGLVKKMLHILPKDVEKATAGDEDTCPAAMACMRQFKVSRAKVTLSRTFLEYPTVWVRYATPKELRAEIISIDRGLKGFQGGDYTLRPPPPAQRAGVPHPRKSHKPKAPKRKRNKTLGVRRAFHREFDKEE